jgi:hypothetical protein
MKKYQASHEFPLAPKLSNVPAGEAVDSAKDEAALKWKGLPPSVSDMGPDLKSAPLDGSDALNLEPTVSGVGFGLQPKQRFGEAAGFKD